VLHVPRGWGHDARADDELSFHLTVGVQRLSNLDLIDHALIHELPGRRGSRDGLADLASIEQVPWRGALRDLVGEISSREVIASALATQLHGIPSRQTQSVRSALSMLRDRAAETEVFVRAPHPGGVLVARGEGDRRRLAFGRSDALVAEPALAVLARSLDGRAHRLADLVGQGPSNPVAQRAVREAIDVGLLEVVDDVRAWGLVAEPDQA
jgi:hypothetical protein